MKRSSLGARVGGPRCSRGSEGGTRRCYKGGSRGSRAQCTRVSRVACAHSVEYPTIVDPIRMQLLFASCFLLFAATLGPAAAQRITTIQLDGVQYFISRMNPYSPELNYFLAYQYCRSLGLQLASFETKEKADSITTYLTNAGYNKYDFWTSGNNLGTDMYLWMSTGLPFNATFNYMRRLTVEHPSQHADDSMDPLDVPQGSTAPQRTARHGLFSRTEHVMTNGCVALKAPTFHWEPQHCGEIKDFICEQTRCYYYNYGSIPVSSAQG
ncbi:unnamed protein product [Leptidea sinapis]|uniref:C-type lectin domain-containing protein n=1 Tax=Leptidea sinapis TaxID=189913 RepID=A0A5E4Q9I9_9NEOP|nr:unnamed protein product [Leptidea sinapis]